MPRHAPIKNANFQKNLSSENLPSVTQQIKDSRKEPAILESAEEHEDKNELQALKNALNQPLSIFERNSSEDALVDASHLTQLEEEEIFLLTEKIRTKLPKGTMASTPLEILMRDDPFLSLRGTFYKPLHHSLLFCSPLPEAVVNMECNTPYIGSKRKRVNS